ncbi:MAG TPA: hypothetical protein VLI93_17580, partial [Acetobacteraceae bacterium]|nr:hypothetical protein [Acetobacteraceae bacterium]
MKTETIAALRFIAALLAQRSPRAIAWPAMARPAISTPGVNRFAGYTPPKVMVSLPIDADVLAWFQSDAHIGVMPPSASFLPV